MTTETNRMDTWKVYIHTNTITGWKYVGITHYDDPNERWKNGLNYKHNPHFDRAVRKYGWEFFDHEIIADGLTKEAANVLERFYIEKYKKCGICYNITEGGDGWDGHSHSEETKAKISQSLKAKNLVPWNKGKTGIYSEETRRRISESQMGRISPTKGKKVGPMSDETKAKIAAANKGKNTWSKGTKRGPYSEEHRKKISEALIGKRKGISTGPKPEQTKAKISASRQGYKWICKPWEPPKQVPGAEIDIYVRDGWKLGKLIIHNNEVYKWDKISQTWQIYEQARKDILLSKVNNQ